MLSAVYKEIKIRVCARYINKEKTNSEHFCHYISSIQVCWKRAIKSYIYNAYRNTIYQSFRQEALKLYNTFSYIAKSVYF